MDSTPIRVGIERHGRTYRIYSYDVWGNAEDGWDVNDVYRGGLIEVEDGTPDIHLLNALFTSGELFRINDSMGVDDALIIYRIADNRPVCELRYERRWSSIDEE
jgi:hypothetical protein